MSRGSSRSTSVYPGQATAGISRSIPTVRDGRASARWDPEREETQPRRDETQEKQDRGDPDLPLHRRPEQQRGADHVRQQGGD